MGRLAGGTAGSGPAASATGLPGLEPARSSRSFLASGPVAGIDARECGTDKLARTSCKSPWLKGPFLTHRQVAARNDDAA